MAKVGRPPKYSEKDILIEKINSYFEDVNKPWTITGLCMHLDICRDTLIEYEKNPQFVDTIKKAKLKIENFVERRLFAEGNHTGIIFNLKNNFGWKDKQEIESKNTNNDTVTIRLEGELEKWSK